MKASITLEQLWFNATLLNFFFRKQAKETLEELANRIGARKNEQEFAVFSDAVETIYDGDLSAFEADCYGESVEDLMVKLGYEDWDDME